MLIYMIHTKQLLFSYAAILFQLTNRRRDNAILENNFTKKSSPSYSHTPVSKYESMVT